MYKSFFRPFLFRLDPERAHHLTIQLMRFAGVVPPVKYLLKRMFDAHSHDGVDQSLPERKSRKIILWPWMFLGCVSRIQLGWLPVTIRMASPGEDWQPWVLVISRWGRSHPTPKWQSQTTGFPYTGRASCYQPYGVSWPWC